MILLNTQYLSLYFLTKNTKIQCYQNGATSNNKQTNQIINSQQQIKMENKHQIIEALKNSTLSDNNIVQKSTKFLKDLKEKPSFCMALMEITDQQALELEVRQGALIQLKNTIRSKWKAQKNSLTNDQKDAIKSTLLTAVIRSSNDYKLLKLYREVITSVVNQENKNWTPLNGILQKLRNQQDTQAAMHCLIGLACAFQFSISAEQKKHLFQFVDIVLPELVNVLQTKQTPQLIYLAIKVIWKCIHYDINENGRILIMDWMTLFKNVISTTNKQYDENYEIMNEQKRGSGEFYYFHSKKWALRIVQRFFQKHMKLKTLDKKQIMLYDISLSWYEAYGNQFIEVIFHQLKTKTSLKIKYFQLKVFHSLLAENPECLKIYAERLQYDILIEYLELTPQDELLANTQPLEFVIRQEEGLMNFKNLKRMATDLWSGINKIDSKIATKKNQYFSGIYFEHNICFLKQKLQSNNLVQKEMAMYLLCKIRNQLTKSDKKEMLTNLIKYYVLPELKSQVMFIRARAVEIFYEYGMLNFDQLTLKNITQALYWCLTQDSHPLIRIKAAIAFNTVLTHKSAKQLVKPKIKQILKVYLQILDVYDLQLLVSSFQSIVSEFSREIGPYSYELVECLIKIFTKLFQRDFQQSKKDDYSGRIELAASGCLKAIIQIVQSPIPNDSILQLQPLIFPLFCFIFQMTGIDYIEDLMSLLNAFLFKVDYITTQLWFYFEVVIFYMTGIPQQYWTQIDSLPINTTSKKILHSIKQEENYQILEHISPILKTYIRKGSQYILTSTNSFHTNLLQQLLSFVDQVYKKGPDQYNGENQLNSSTLLLIYFLQNKPKLSQIVLLRFWECAKRNMALHHSKTLHKINIQLICLLFWVASSTFLNLIHYDQSFQRVINQLVKQEKQLDQQHQRKRAILGLSQLIGIKERSKLLISHFPVIYQILMKMISSNVDFRLQLDDDNDFSDISELEDQQIEALCIGQLNRQDWNTDEEEEEQINRILSGEEDEKLWDQIYDQDYQSNLEEVDELQFFRNMIQKIQNEQKQFYEELLTLSPSKDLKKIAKRIQRAIQMYTE